MDKRVIAVLALVVVCSARTLCYAEVTKACAGTDTVCMLEKERVATSPAGAVVECLDVFTGKICAAFEIAATGERKITVRNETGECRVFPFTTTTKVVDGAFNAVTFNQLKAGEKVKVEYAEESGVEKAKSVTVEK